jgi:TolB-like protein
VRCVALLAVQACASAPARRSASPIAAADAEARRALASEQQLDAAKIPAATFAVLPFTVVARDTTLRPLSYGIADLLLTDLSHTDALRPVERMRVDAMLRELDLVDRGIVDPRTGPRVGRLVGARRLLIGELTATSDGALHIRARVVDAIAGTVQELVAADAPMARFFDAEKSLALRVYEALGITLTAAQRDAVEQQQTTQLAAMVAYGKGVEAEARGDFPAATAAFGDAVRLDAGFVSARRQLAAAASPSGGAAPSAASAAAKAGSVARVLDLSSNAINQPIAQQASTSKPSEAADAPLAANTLIQFIITVRIH